jgi:hypothetical protein
VFFVLRRHPSRDGVAVQSMADARVQLILACVL